MRRFLGLLGLICVLSYSASAQDKQASGTRTLKLKMNYTGSGTVDEKHKIIVFLFDSPDFAQNTGVMPIGSDSTAAKNGTINFADVGASPVYAVAVFDPTGDYDGQSGPPPSGSTVAMYGGQTPEPIKIEPGKTVEIELAFDDSFKMP